MSKVAKIKLWDIANGEGIRTSIFFAGCSFHCKGCHNENIWDYDVGDYFDIDYYNTKIKPTINEYINGISILGGEPLDDRNVVSTYNLVQWFRKDFPDKSIWLWSGYNYESIKDKMDFACCNNDFITYHALLGILENINILIDGQYIEKESNLSLLWRGSSNQRIINVKETLNEGKVVLYEE